METLTSRERINAALEHRESDRVAIVDHPWGTAVERWRTEGFPADQSPEEFFGFEMHEFGLDASLQLASETLQETDEYLLVKNSDGAVVKRWKGATTTPGWIDFLVKDRASWEEHRGRLAMNERRVRWDAELQRMRSAREKGLWSRLVAATGYDRVQTLIGSERLLVAMLDDPDWVKELFSAVAGLIIQAAEEMLCRGLRFDGVIFCQDMGYRNATLFSPALYRELAKPSDRRLCDFFKARGVKVMLHSCGNVTELVPDLIDAGFDSLEPLEVKAGMDLVRLKKDYGEKLAFMGGIDVRAMADADPEAIEREIRTKLPCAMKGGGYIYHSDHSVPDSVSFKQFSRTLELVLEVGRYG